MPGKKRIWTEAEDEALRQMIAAGGSTNDAAARFGCGRQYALAHAKKIGAMQPRKKGDYVREFRSESREFVEQPPYKREASPLRPGHPETWGPIVRGTILEGQEYPR
jgi:hypothetical protein